MKNYKTVVLGATTKSERYAYKACQKLQENDIEVVPIGIRKGKCAGILIQNVAKDSPAYYMGLKGGYINGTIVDRPIVLGGDIVLSIDGHKFDSEENILKAVDYLNSIKSGTTYVFKVMRFGKIIDVSWVAK